MECLAACHRVTPTREGHDMECLTACHRVTPTQEDVMECLAACHRVTPTREGEVWCKCAHGLPSCDTQRRGVTCAVRCCGRTHEFDR